MAAPVEQIEEAKDNAEAYKVNCLMAPDTRGILEPKQIRRRAMGPLDVIMEVKYCGMCHSDLSQLRGEWAQPHYYPMTPGHELAGVVKKIGSKVEGFKVGDKVGIGCIVGSCKQMDKCPSCMNHLEQYCQMGHKGLFTYNCCVKEEVFGVKNSPMGELLHGGYSEAITVDHRFLIKVDDSIKLETAGPIFCAGITMYSPLRHFDAVTAEGKAGSRKRVGIWGFGGLGHMGVKIAAAAGCEVTVLSRGQKKKEKALAAGAKRYIDTKKPEEVAAAAWSMDLIIDTISCNHDLRAMMACLGLHGVMCLVGLPADAIPFMAFDVIFGRKSIAGSLIGGIQETQECCDFIAAHPQCIPDVEVIKAEQANWALHMLHHGKNAKSRYVIDCSTIKDATECKTHDDFKLEQWVNKMNTKGAMMETGMIFPESSLHPATNPAVQQESQDATVGVTC